MTDQEEDLLEGLRRIDQRQARLDALLVGSLLETYLRILGKPDEADQVRTIVRNVNA